MSVFDQCPQCEAATHYRDDGGGDKSLICSQCDWEAVTVEWFATAREPAKG